MKKSKFLLFIISMLGISVYCMAQSPPVKVAFVDIQEVMAACNEGRNESSSWQQWAEKKQSELQGLQKDLASLKSQLEIQGPKLNNEARIALEDDIQTKSLLLQRAQEDAQRETEKRQNRIANNIYIKVLPVIEKMAKERDLDSVHIIDKNRDLYVKPSLLITNDVIRAYDVAYPSTINLQPVKK